MNGSLTNLTLKRSFVSTSWLFCHHFFLDTGEIIKRLQKLCDGDAIPGQRTNAHMPLTADYQASYSEVECRDMCLVCEFPVSTFFMQVWCVD